MPSLINLDAQHLNYD